MEALPEAPAAGRHIHDSALLLGRPVDEPLPAQRQRYQQRIRPPKNIGENEIQLRNADQLQIAASILASLDVLPYHYQLPLFDFQKIWQSFPDEQIKFKIYQKNFRI